VRGAGAFPDSSASDTIQVALEQPFYLPPGEARCLRDLLERKRLLDVLLHDLRDPDQAAV